MQATRFPAREQQRPGLLVVVAACLVLGVLSLAFRSGLGYDPWAWLVWGRELTHLDLNTLGGPSWKPLPVILIAPFTWLGAARAVDLARARARRGVRGGRAQLPARVAVRRSARPASSRRSACVSAPTSS